MRRSVGRPAPGWEPGRVSRVSSRTEIVPLATMAARSKLRGQRKEAASSFGPFGAVESFLVARVNTCCWDIYPSRAPGSHVIITASAQLAAQSRVRTLFSRVSSRGSYH